MAKDKKSFVLYCDLIHTVELLTDKQAGELFKHILLYVNDKNPVTENPITKISFEPIKQQLKRDLIKFEEVKVKRSNAGKLSAEKRAEQKATKLTRVKSVQHTSTNPTVNDNDNVNVINIYRKFDHLKLSHEEFSRLEKRWTKKQIDQVLDSIENYKENTKYKSLALTAKNWLVKDYPEKPIKLKPIKHWNQQ